MDCDLHVQPTTVNLAKYAKLDAEIEQAAKDASALAVGKVGTSNFCCGSYSRNLQVEQQGVLL